MPAPTDSRRPPPSTLTAPGALDPKLIAAKSDKTESNDPKCTAQTGQDIGRSRLGTMLQGLRNSKLGHCARCALNALAMRGPGRHSAQAIFGGKHAGLCDLRDTLNGTGVKVPPFVGIGLDELPVEGESEGQREGITPKGLTKKVAKFVQSISAQNLDARFMVRSSSAQEDRAEQANAGCFETVANVPADPTALVAAMRSVADSFTSVRSQAQMALYGPPSKIAEERKDGIVLQEMIGERADQPETVPASGVGLMPDSRSRAENIFSLVSSWGHGGGVVDGSVVTDETIGVITPDTHSIHARTRVMRKPERLGPVAGEQKLVSLSNEQKARQPALSSAQIERYANVLMRLRAQHPSGADMEFVSQLGKDYVVQQRSQDRPKIEVHPTFISQSFLDAHPASHFPVEVVSFRQYGVLTIDAEHRLVADSLNDAFFKDYLGLVERAKQGGVPAPDIKAVFVPPLPNANVNANAHAALMLRREGVAIVEVSDRHVLARLATDEKLVLDEQRGCVLFDTLPETDDVAPGRLQFPAPPTYSVPDSPSVTFDPHNHDPSARPQALEKLLSTVAAHVRENLTPAQALVKLKQDVAQSETLTLSDIADSLAPLLKNAYGALKVAKRHDHPKLTRVTQELTFDLLRLAHAVEHKRDRMHQLFYVNAIEAALVQLPVEHPDQENVFSLRSEFQAIRTERTFVQWFWTQCEAQAMTAQSARMNVAGQQADAGEIQLPSTRSWRALQAIKHLHQLSYVLPNPALRQQWLDGLTRLACDAQCSDADFGRLRARALAHFQVGTFEAMLRDLKLTLPSDKTLDALPLKVLLSDEWRVERDWQQLSVLNDHLRRMTDTWLADDGQVQDNLTLLRTYAASVPAALNALDSSKPNQVIALTHTLGTALEQIDHSIKKIMSTPNLPDTQRVGKVRALVGLLSQFTMPILATAYSGDPKTKKRLDQLHAQAANIFRSSHDIDISVMRGRRFNVCYALISAASNKTNVEPHSLGDLHTLLHQNMRCALGKINADNAAWRCLPSASQNIAKSFAEKLAAHPQLQAMQTEEGDEAYTAPVLMAVDKTDEGFESHYAIALRTHGFRVIVAENEQTQQMDVRIGLDGGNEYKRFNISQALFKESWGRRLGLEALTIDARDWPNAEAAPAFMCGWSYGTKGQTEQSLTASDHVCDVIADITGKLIATSYRYAFGTYENSRGLTSDYALLTDVAPLFAQYREQGDLVACAELILDTRRTNKALNLGAHVSLEDIVVLLEKTQRESDSEKPTTAGSVYDFFRLLQASTSVNALERELVASNPEQLFEMPHASFQELERVCTEQPDSAAMLTQWVRTHLDQFKTISPALFWGKHTRLSTTLLQLNRFWQQGSVGEAEERSLLQALAGLPWEGVHAVSDWLFKYPAQEHFQRFSQANDVLRSLNAHDFTTLASDSENCLENVELLMALGPCSAGIRSNMLAILTKPSSGSVQGVREAVVQVIRHSPPDAWLKAAPVVKALSSVEAPVNASFATFLQNNLVAMHGVPPRFIRSLIRAAANPLTPHKVLEGTYDDRALTIMARGIR